MKESLSALLDGECQPDELDRLLAELERDPELREHFSRQCLARDSRMGGRIRSAQFDFSSRVLAAIEREPEAPVVAPFGDRVRRIPWRAVASLAAAAAVGAVAVLAVRPGAPGGIPATQSAAVSPSAVVPVSAVPTPAEPVDTQFSDLDDERAQQLRNYLMTHSQSHGQQSVGTTLGYARYTAYTDRPAKRPPAEPTPEQKR